MSHQEWEAKIAAVIACRTDEIVRDFGGDGAPSRLLELADEVEAAVEVDDKAQIMAALVARELRRRAATSLN